MTSNVASPSHSNHLIPVGNRRVEAVYYPQVPLTDSFKAGLVADCKNSPDAEVCGLIDVQETIYYIGNDHEVPETNFFFNQEEYNIAVNECFENNPGIAHPILGIFHTHPTNIPWPSPRDIRGWPNPQLGWRYFIVTGIEVLEWRLV